MSNQLRIRDLRKSDIGDAHSLVNAVFDEFVAPQFLEEGIIGFKSFIEASKWEEWLKLNHLVLIAESDSAIVGVIAVRNWDHVFLLFVATMYQRKGIARKLVSNAVRRCVDAGHKPEKFTVNSSPNAVDAYRRIGFEPTGEEREENGMRVVPMEMGLSEEIAG